jgi:hypothetical protein
LIAKAFTIIGFAFRLPQGLKEGVAQALVSSCHRQRPRKRLIVNANLRTH